MCTINMKRKTSKNAFLSGLDAIIRVNISAIAVCHKGELHGRGGRIVTSPTPHPSRGSMPAGNRSPHILYPPSIANFNAGILYFWHIVQKVSDALNILFQIHLGKNYRKAIREKNQIKIYNRMNVRYNIIFLLILTNYCMQLRRNISYFKYVI